MAATYRRRRGKMLAEVRAARKGRKQGRPTIAGEVVTRNIGDPEPEQPPPAPRTRTYRGNTYG